MDGEVKERQGEREMKKERKMWLEPQRNPTSRDTALAKEDTENRTEGQIVEEHYGEETPEMNVDGELEWSEEKDRSRTGGSEENTEDGEVGGTLERERIVSGEDEFVTVSSSGEEEREDDFKDCVEYWDEERDSEDTVDEEEFSKEPGRETPQKFVFCVIGKSLSADEAANSAPPAKNAVEPEYDEVREFVEIPSSDAQSEMKTSNSFPDFGTIKRDSQTERLLLQWREKTQNDEEPQSVSPVPNNPYADVPVQLPYDQAPPLEKRHSGAMTPEEEEAIRIRMSGAWSMSEETKRHSHAPHLKWATDVVREILGKSDENVDNPQPEQGEAAGQNAEIPTIKAEDWDLEKELEDDEDEESLELEGLRGMAKNQAGMHAGVGAAMHGDAPTHTHIFVEAGGSREGRTTPLIHVEDGAEAGDDETELKDIDKTSSDAEVEDYLTASNTLYKPSSCPSLYESDSPVKEGSEESSEEGSEEDSEGAVEDEVVERVEEVGTDEIDKRERAGAMVKSSCSFKDLGTEARLRRRGIRKTTQRRKENTLKEEAEDGKEEDEEGAGRDRRTRVFSTSDDEDGRSKSWGELDLRNVLDTIGKRKRNSRFFNAAQLYQQYSEAAQNFEILRQARSDVVSICEGSSPASSPPPARRPLPPLPVVPPHPHSLSHHGSVTSVQSLPLPQPPRTERRASSPRLSTSLGQSATLWRELPAVRNSPELQEVSEDQRKLQEVRFEVVTSEASYCRSLDIVVDHFVKSKTLGALLTTQDRNWLFSRLSDVRAISHSFLSKLEEKVESDILHFTVCDVIARHCQRFKMVYVPYLTNQSYQDATYQRLMNENQGFRRIVEKLERSPVCQRLPLRSFLVLPFQRITRIKLLVQNIVKRTTPGTAEATQAIKALKLLEKLIQEGNDSITQMKSIESLVSLSARVDFECKTLPLISQSRRLVREGKVTELMDFSLKDTERSVYLHLFNDYLLLSQQKEGGRFTVIDTSPVSELRAENCRVKLHSLQKNLFKLHMSHRALLLRTDTQSDKLRWISALSRPHAEVDFSAAQDFTQMQCIRAFVAQQPDELSLEKADIILVHQQSSDHWVEGTRLSDRHRGWIPESHLETISNYEIRKRNLSDALKLTTATAQVRAQN